MATHNVRSIDVGTVLGQGGDDVGVAADSGVHQRRPLLQIVMIHIRPVLEQQPHNLDAAPACCCRQCRPPLLPAAKQSWCRGLVSADTSSMPRCRRVYLVGRIDVHLGDAEEG